MYYFGCVITLFSSWILFSNEAASNYCNQTLGMNNGKIADNQITTRGDSGGRGGKDSRLNVGPGWCNAAMENIKIPEFKDDVFLQVNFQSIYQITGFSLTGGSGEVKQYSTGNFVQLSYKTNEHDKYTVYKKFEVFNLKSPNTRFISMQPPIHARYLRYQPENDQNAKCVQLEFYGCKLEKSSCLGPILHSGMGYSATSTRDKLSPSYIAKTNGPFPWAPKSPVTTEQNVLVDLKDSYFIVGVRTFTPSYASNALPQPPTFTISYILKGFTWQTYAGGSTKTYEFDTSETLKSMVHIHPIFAATQLKISPKIANDGRQFLKIEIYGCKRSDESIFREATTSTPEAPTASPSISPSAMSNPTTTTTITTNTEKSVATTKMLEAEIKSYEIRQGHRFRDVSYVGKASKDTLHGGKGSLVDGTRSTQSPIKFPEFWVGWNKKELPRPFIIVKLERQATLKSFGIISYVDRKEALGSFAAAQIQFLYGAADSWSAAHHACPSQQYSDGAIVFNIVFSQTVAKQIKLQFNYSDEFLVFSEFFLNAGQNAGAVTLTLSKTSCKEANFQNQQMNGGSNSRMLIFIIVSVVVVAVLAIAVCLVYMYRKKISQRVCGRRSHRRENKGLGINGNSVENDVLLQSLTPNPIYEVRPNPEPDHMYVTLEEQGSDKNKLIEGNKAIEDVDDNIYAAPDVVGVGYAEIAVDPAKEEQSYTEPDSPHDQDNVEMNPIYEGTRIYEDLYQTVTGSSLYADPDTESQRKSIEIRKFPRDRLKFLEKIGTGQFGEVHICEVESLGTIVGSQAGHCSWIMSGTVKVAVKLLKAGVDKNIEKEFMKEVRVMARLQHDNVVKLLGICEEEPKCMVVEYMENGDLNQFLHNYSLCNEPSGDAHAANTLNEDILLYMCMQIANGMHYLASQGFIHRDLATRNCLVGHSFTVKISDFGMSRYLYSKHYYRIEGKAVLPIRWMAPESLFYGTFTSQSDIWSFGVTVWEMFTFAREPPFNHLSDQQVIENACSVVAKQRRSFRCLPRPDGCPSNVYAEMQRCWERSPADRPTFLDLFQFFQSIVNSTEASV